MTDGVSTTTRNEAAERLRRALQEGTFGEGHGRPDYWYGDGAVDLDEALATERRLTVERIREKLIGSGYYSEDGWLNSILLDELGEQRP